ncbi:MAG: Gfo/Idh/MocA family oxidoreductase [Anaerolineae bacterium]|nr:Gfo/Idh/MocA family oxidoreductase [Anaerolineae bacterium]
MTTKVGIIGCGNISPIYLKNVQQTFKNIEVAACSDLIPERSQTKGTTYGVPRICTTEELLEDPEIEIGVNLTTPDVHFPVAMQIIEAGKSVHSEKPMSLTREQGKQLLAAAKEGGVRVGGAPDTFLGGGHQTCRKLIDDGWIGEPIAATAFMTCHGHESWHPGPAFYYEVGGGPMFDMGPYYLTALINMMGPVRRVSGEARITFPQRTITSEPLYGTIIDVETPTHIASTLQFESGAIGTIITSFDVWAADLPRIEIYGTEGSLSVPDPNGFGGPVRVRRAGATEWQEVPLTHGYAENSRGIGVADLANALQSGRSARASGELTYHVLDIMHATLDSAREGRHINIESSCERPAPLPLGLLHGYLDA